MVRIKTMSQMSLLFLAWVALFYLVTFLTQLTLTPWDTAIDWPAVGTWQRTLNDFFATNPGRLVISVPVVLISIYLTLATLRRQPDHLERFIRMHWLFILVLLLAYWVSVTLNHWLHPYPSVMYDPNYLGFHLAILPSVTIIGLCLLWLGKQARLAVYRLRHVLYTHIMDNKSPLSN